ncbi:PREDICTED: ankyrin repeat and LEM domain-containing protein 2 [Vollenhovia emeryi]|uniref:ankyrin repeat and LEM domain-containing protein 2 n=1 Tax=Vollenhovia emeryi TaxID=411798 RepID=UPI0005F53577|nr:PREDICTED: ankyrin repeat and LEM domain-containing protein 2 [Vollenhovia emeryi]
MTPTSRECGVNLPNEDTAGMADARNENMCEPRPNLPAEAQYYAVYIPLEHRNPDEEEIHVYVEKSEALNVIKSIKEHKKSRLQIFKNYADAVAYAKTGFEQSYGYSTVATAQEQSSFKAPSMSDTIAFKRLVEKGNVEAVMAKVWENPRYLISSGDTPAILQMGFRYNALHIAAKEGQSKMCELILNTVGDPKFMRWHYGDDKCTTYLNPAQIMQDLYLNTPDKGLNETPLHFAVKHGHKDVVRVLISYSQCIKTLPNKFEQLPMELICSRRETENEALKREIRMLLEEQFYVPVLRTEGNTCPPIIGEPFSPTSPLILNRDPISPRVELRAFAGPMTKPQATEFQKKLKTPPRINFKRGQGDTPGIVNSPSIALRLQDTEKGLERVGRDLAEEYQVPWKEYWPFLKDFVDFRSDDGLTKLEKYLQQRSKDNEKQLFYLRNLTNSACAPVSCEGEPISCQEMPKESKEDAINDIQYLCDKLGLCSLSTDIDDEEDSDSESLEFFTPPSSPEHIQDNFDDDMQIAEEGSLIFIEGFSPTKLDYAVYNALSTAIGPDTYPHIYRWRHDMQLVMQRDPCRFNAKSLRRQLFTNN